MLALCGGLFFINNGRIDTGRRGSGNETTIAIKGTDMAIVEFARPRRSLLLLIALSLWTAPAAAETAIKFTLDRRIEGPAAPFFVAIDRGYFKAEGLDVSIDPGASVAEPITRIASGSYEMGAGDINALIKARDANPQTAVKAIFIVYDKPPYAVVARKSRGITQPKDLEGKKLGAPNTEGAFAYWPIFVQANGINAAKVTIERVSLPVRDPMLAAGQLDAVTSYSFSSYIDLKDRGVPVDDIVVMLMANYGVQIYGTAIMVNTKFADEKPETVKAFLRAYVKALRETVRDPARAVESVVNRSSGAKKDVELERLHMAIHDNILTPAVKANGYGDIDSARFAQAIEQIGSTYQFKDRAKATDVFDGSFLPPASDRKAK
jgi:NitT/TauT family transport system substrate-binding protein